MCYFFLKYLVNSTVKPSGSEVFLMGKFLITYSYEQIWNHSDCYFSYTSLDKQHLKNLSITPKISNILLWVIHDTPFLAFQSSYTFVSGAISRLVSSGLTRFFFFFISYLVLVSALSHYISCLYFLPSTCLKKCKACSFMAFFN